MIRKFGLTGLQSGSGSSSGSSKAYQKPASPLEPDYKDKMYAPYYAKKPATSSSAGGGGTGTLDRPTTLNLDRPLGSTTTSGTGGSSTAGMPNKPIRYTPVLPLTGSSTQTGSGGGRPSTGYSGGGYTSSYAGRSSNNPYGGGGRDSEVITVPPSSSSKLYERPTGPQTHGTHLQYYYNTPVQQQHQQISQGGSQGGVQQGGLRVSGQVQPLQHVGGMQQGGQGMMGSISKSTQNLIESIPDVFCLSCPPAEFKFSEAYRAKTLPRTGKEVEVTIQIIEEKN